MLQVSDIRETRVYQEAKEEGLQEGMEQERRRAITAMATAQLAAEDIARLLGLSVELVRNELARLQP